MKTKELINRVNGVRGIAAYNQGHRVTFYEIEQTFPFYTMDEKNVDFGQGVSNFANIRDTNMSRLSYVIDAIREYLETPLSEREEEKRYYLRLNAPEAGSLTLYRTKGLGISGTNLNMKKDWNILSFIFTESEISEMDITGFKKDPVE